jgi:hypothetical protein
MDLVSIGAFARVSRLSPKALRLYDELGVQVEDDLDLRQRNIDLAKRCHATAPGHR